MSIKNSQELHQRAHRAIEEFLDSKQQRTAFVNTALINRISRLPEDDLKAVAVIYRQHYQELRTQLLSTGVPTHEVITRLAFDVLEHQGVTFDSAAARQIMSESTAPDSSADWVILLSDHFCKKQSDGQYRNFLDGSTTAMSQFIKYHEVYTSPETGDKARSLAWSLHYLQDLTQPHHADNYPAVLVWPHCADTHVDFEEKAQVRVSAPVNQHTYKTCAMPLVTILENEWLAGKQNFAERVYEFSRANVEQVELISHGDHSASNCWDNVIDAALPLAVAATVVVLRNSPIY